MISTVALRLYGRVDAAARFWGIVEQPEDGCDRQGQGAE